MTLAFLIAAGYLAGSIPTGYWLVRAVKGIDIRTIGSGTTGATNAARAFGGGAARLAVLVSVMAIDVAKGFAPTYAAMEISGAAAGVATGSAALLGNYRPVFLRFHRGGKMVATGGGVLFAVCGWVALAGGAIWIATFLLTRYASVASIVAALALPAIAVAFGYPWPVIAFTAVSALAIVFLHRANLRRLRAGTENRFRGLRRPARA